MGDPACQLSTLDPTFQLSTRDPINMNIWCWALNQMELDTCQVGMGPGNYIGNYILSAPHGSVGVARTNSEKALVALALYFPHIPPLSKLSHSVVLPASYNPRLMPPHYS